MRRRTFLQTMGGWLGAAAVFVLAPPRPDHVRFPFPNEPRPNAPTDDEIRRRLSSLFSSPHNASALGAHFLRTQGQRAGQEQLLAYAGVAGAATRVEGVALRAAFAQARRADFEAGRVVLLDGWVLARCEVACCALLASLE